MIVIAAAFFAAATFWMFLPLLSVSLRHEGVDDLWVGIISALPWVGLLATSFLIPVLVRSWGLKRIILAGMGLSSFAFLGFAVTRSIWLWALLCLVMGAALALRWVGLDTWMNGSFPAHLRGKLTGLYELVLTGSIAFGPAMLALSGDTGYLPFFAAALVTAATAIVIGFVGQEVAPKTEETDPTQLSFDILRDNAACFTGIFMVGLTEAVNLSLLPLFGLSNGFSLHVSALLVVVVQIGGALGATIIGSLADHLDRKILCLFCAGIMVVMPVGLILALHQLLWPWLLVWGMVQGGLFTVGIVTLASRYSGVALAGAITLSMVLYTFGGIIGPPLLGMLISLGGCYGFAFGLAGMALVGSSFMWRFRLTLSR